MPPYDREAWEAMDMSRMEALVAKASLRAERRSLEESSEELPLVHFERRQRRISCLRRRDMEKKKRQLSPVLASQLHMSEETI